MKSYTIVLIAILLIAVIGIPLIITGCTKSEYNIKKYPSVRIFFEYKIINNLSLSGKDEALLYNQDRGFRGEVYYSLGTTLGFPPDNDHYMDRLNNQIELYGEDKANIMQCYIYLFKYKDKDLDAEALDGLKNYFEYLKSKNIRILLRFAYEYISSENNDAKDSQIIRHLNQIGQFINENEKLFNDVVYAMQFGLIGLWGEGHGAHNHHNTRKLLNKLCEIVPENIYIMVRTPEFLSQVPEKYEHRFSVHDDFLVGVNHEWGMMDWNKPQYKDLLNKNQYAIADGEMPWGDYKENDIPYHIDGLNLVKQVRDYGFTTLSVTHNYKEKGGLYHLEKWKTEYLTKEILEENNLPYLETMLVDGKISIYHYLQYHLGYNIGVSNLLQFDNKTSFMINNFGLAAPFEYELQVIADGEKIDIEQQLLTQFGQQVITINKKVSEIKVRFVHRRTGATIKLANDLPYSSDGYNTIL